MKRRVTYRGVIALLIAAAGTVAVLASRPGTHAAPAPVAEPAPASAAPVAPAADEIDVEQAVAFPYDI